MLRPCRESAPTRTGRFRQLRSMRLRSPRVWPATRSARRRSQRATLRPRGRGTSRVGRRDPRPDKRKLLEEPGEPARQQGLLATVCSPRLMVTPPRPHHGEVHGSVATARAAAEERPPAARPDLCPDLRDVRAAQRRHVEPTDCRADPTFGEFLVALERGRVDRVELRTKDNSAHVALLTGKTEEEVFGHHPDPRNGELVPGASAAAV